MFPFIGFLSRWRLINVEPFFPSRFSSAEETSCSSDKTFSFPLWASSEDGGVPSAKCSFDRSFSFFPGAGSAGGPVAGKVCCVVSFGSTEEEDCAVEPICSALCSGKGANSSALATCSVDFTWNW